jgi:hypothetical protein
MTMLEAAIARRSHEERILAGGLALALVAAMVVAFAGPIAVLFLVVAAAAVFLFVRVATRPVLAAYIFLGALPIVGGIDRGSIIPLLRPSEAVQVFLTSAVLAGGFVRMLRGERMFVRFTRLDRTIVVMALLGSLWPLCWQLARGQTPTSTDIQATLVLWRLGALYAMFRWVVRTPEEVRRCLWIAVGGACVLSLLAIVQSAGGVHLGGPWTTTVGGDTTGRGGATLNSSIAVGDYLAYTLTIVLMWTLHHTGPRVLLRVAAAVLVLGSLGTGQFSAWISLLIVVVVVAQHEGQLRRAAAWFAPLLLVGAAVAWPVVSTRLAGFGSGHGLPQSWLGRIDNLSNFYLPRLAGFHWVLGVRPDSVLPAPETWRQTIFLESGVLWFFWVGGIPLFVAFCFFAHRAFVKTGQVARTRRDDIGVAALATRAALCSILVLSLIDMHLTLRGGGDLFFMLLGLAANANVPERLPGDELRMSGRSSP